MTFLFSSFATISVHHREESSEAMNLQLSSHPHTHTHTRIESFDKKKIVEKKKYQHNNLPQVSSVLVSLKKKKKKVEDYQTDRFTPLDTKQLGGIEEKCHELWLSYSSSALFFFFLIFIYFFFVSLQIHPFNSLTNAAKVHPVVFIAAQRSHEKTLV